MLNGQGLVSLRPVSAVVLGAFALVAGALQIVATTALGRARSDAIVRAAAEGATLYLLGALATAVGLLVVWLLRRRPPIAAVVLVVWQAAVFWPLSKRATWLGLAYHGEYILHHFLALVCAATCITVLASWRRRNELGPARLVPVTLGLLGAGTLAFLHVASQPSVQMRASSTLHETATAALLLSVLAGLAIGWRTIRPPAMRIVAVLLLTPLLLRIGLAFPEGLTGAAVPMGGRTALMTAVVLAATGVFVAFRPRLPTALRIAAVSLSAIATALLYVAYRRGFGELEDDVGGLAQSLFGFPLPYPNYVSDPKLFASMVGLFFIFAVVTAGLLSSTERPRGIAFGLLCVTGLGLTNPQLALMAGAGLLLFLDIGIEQGTHGNPQDEGESTSALPPSTPVEDILLAAAERLDLPDPVTLADAPRAIVALRGEVATATIDVRARRLRSEMWAIDLQIGMIGRGRPDAELVPDSSQDGTRPAHELGRTHRIRGSARALEQLGDPVLDAMMPFPRARARFWEAGITIALGDDLEQLDAARLARLIARMARSLR